MCVCVFKRSWHVALLVWGLHQRLRGSGGVLLVAYILAFATRCSGILFHNQNIQLKIQNYQTSGIITYTSGGNCVYHLYFRYFCTLTRRMALHGKNQTSVSIVVNFGSFQYWVVTGPLFTSSIVILHMYLVSRKPLAHRSFILALSISIFSFEIFCCVFFKRPLRLKGCSVLCLCFRFLETEGNG